MITLLDTIGPAIWRASWQAAVIGVLVVLLLRCFGERLSPRWRFLLWGVVLRGCCAWPLRAVPGACSIWSAGIRRRMCGRSLSATPMQRSRRFRTVATQQLTRTKRTLNRRRLPTPHQSLPMAQVSAPRGHHPCPPGPRWN